MGGCYGDNIFLSCLKKTGEVTLLYNTFSMESGPCNKEPEKYKMGALNFTIHVIESPNLGKNDHY